MTSFDPRTWHLPGHVAAKPTSAPEPLAPPQLEPGEPTRAGWLGLALSALILAGGAAGAYAMRPADTGLNAGSQPVSASG